MIAGPQPAVLELQGSGHLGDSCRGAVEVDIVHYAGAAPRFLEQARVVDRAGVIASDVYFKPLESKRAAVVDHGVVGQLQRVTTLHRVKVNRAGIVHHQVVQGGELSNARPVSRDVEERAHRDIQNTGATAADRGREVIAGPAKCRAHRVGITGRSQPQAVDVQGPGLQGLGYRSQSLPRGSRWPRQCAGPR